MKLVLLLFVFLIPLLGAAVNFGYEQIKTIFFIFSISLIGFIWLLEKPRLSWSIINIISAAFILVLLATAVLGIDLKQSLLGSHPYFQGWLVYVYLGLFSIMVASSKISFKLYAFVLSLSAGLVAVSAIRQWMEINLFHLQISTYSGRVVSTFGQPNFYAGFLLLSLPFSYFLFKNPAQALQVRRLNYFGLVSGLLSTVGIFVSYSRSAIMMALILVILGLIDQLKIRLKLSLAVVGVILLSVFIALKFSSGIVGNEISRPFQIINPDLTRESVEKRAYIWPIAWQLINIKPLAGYGLENINQAFFSYFEVNKHSLFEENLKISPVLIGLKDLNIDRSHNYPLDLLLFSGVFGLLGWLGLVSLLFWKLIQNYHDQNNKVLLVSLLTYLVWVQFQNQSIVHLIYFWFLVGFIYSREQVRV